MFFKSANGIANAFASQFGSVFTENFNSGDSVEDSCTVSQNLYADI